MPFFGRSEELEQLEQKFASSQGQMAVVYGRRRVGKSSLIKEFAKNKDAFFLEGLEGQQTQTQIEEFKRQISKSVSDPFLDQIKFRDWPTVLQYFTEKVVKKNRKKRLVIIWDEIQWLAVRRGALISHIKNFWDNEWKNENVMFIMCGSIASYMLKNVIRSKALYGRINLEILLKGLKPRECQLIFKSKRSPEEMMKYMFVFGGIPKYLEEVDLNKSFSQNINQLCFKSNAIMLNEMDKIFYNQFKSPSAYLAVVKALRGQNLNQNEISKKTGISSGGRLKDILEQLVQAEFLMEKIPLDKTRRSKIKKYTLSDEFIHFYQEFMEPNLRLIQDGRPRNPFEQITKNKFEIWCGFAFERFCLKHAYELADLMGFGNEVMLATSHYKPGPKGFQIDLLYQRSDKVIVVCEIKHLNSPVTTSVIKEMEKKLGLFTPPRGYGIERALISLYGPDSSLAEAEYFHHQLSVSDIFS